MQYYRGQLYTFSISLSNEVFYPSNTQQRFRGDAKTTIYLRHTIMKQKPKPSQRKKNNKC